MALSGVRRFVVAGDVASAVEGAADIAVRDTAGTTALPPPRSAGRSEGPETFTAARAGVARRATFSRHRAHK